ncbi:MAG: gliding motility protein GldM [Prevotellaceae bacterium]|jgi:gliding motility-associated protein GldM|nr:gliding motility protein GldM [Prevotellaceae bacterium]
MAGGQQTPRQKMINMMYLVLTAMLALNVSAEIVDAFAKIERGLDQTVIITDIKNDNTLKFFEGAVAELGQKAVEWRDKAKITRDKTKELKKYVQELKIELIKTAEGDETIAVKGDTIYADSIGKMDDLNVANQILLGVNDNGKAYDLHKKVLEYRDFLLKDIVRDNAEIESFINELLDFSNPKKGLTDVRDWETFTFNSTPLISAIALLSKIQVDILNCESYVLEHLRTRIGKDDLKISNVEAAVSNPNGMILKNSSGEAEVFLVAFDESIQAEAHVGGRTIQMKAGRAKIPFSGTNIGPNVVSGDITYRNASGGTERRNFKFEYHVIEPSLAISPTKMNVFYLGVDNPVELSVSGVSQNDVNINITNGAMTSTGKTGEYIVKPASVGKCNISVSAMVNGEKRNIGVREYRVKRVPNPEPSLFNITGKSVTRSQLSSVQGVFAKMPVDFDFDLPFDVLSFDIEVISQGGYVKAESSKSNRFTEAQRKLMTDAKVGSRIFITNIKAKAKGVNDVRDLPNIDYTVGG